MCGGGAEHGYVHNIYYTSTHYRGYKGSVYSGGGGAFWYGIVEVLSKQELEYTCGTYGQSTSFIGIECGGGVGGASINGGVYTVNLLNDEFVIIESVASNGNNGNYTNYSYGANGWGGVPSLSGGASIMAEFTPTQNLIALNQFYGKGCDTRYLSAPTNGNIGINATTGYLKIEKI